MGDALELKLGKLMMALRGVDPDQLAKNQQQQDNNKKEEEKQQQQETSPKKDDEEEDDDVFEIVGVGTKNSGGEGDNEAVLEAIKNHRNKQQQQIDADKATTNTTTTASDGNVNVESLMKQFVSTLREDIKTGKASTEKKKSKDDDHHEDKSDEQQQQLPDYSAMSMDELLNQIDEMVDKTTAAAGANETQKE